MTQRNVGQEIANELHALANAITPLGGSMYHDPRGNVVGSVTEALIMIGESNYAIASAIAQLADAMLAARERT